MIGGLPALAGAVQLTLRLVAEPEAATTVGSAGAAVGGSSTSVRVIVTVVTALPPLPSSAVTVTV